MIGTTLVHYFESLKCNVKINGRVRIAYAFAMRRNKLPTRKGAHCMYEGSVRSSPRHGVCPMQIKETIIIKIIIIMDFSNKSFFFGVHSFFCHLGASAAFDAFVVRSSRRTMASMIISYVCML